MQQDKEDRRFHYKQKNSKKDKSFVSENKDKNKIQKEFKHRKAEIKQDELWEDWQQQYK